MRTFLALLSVALVLGCQGKSTEYSSDRDVVAPTAVEAAAKAPTENGKLATSPTKPMATPNNSDSAKPQLESKPDPAATAVKASAATADVSPAKPAAESGNPPVKLAASAASGDVKSASNGNDKPAEAPRGDAPRAARVTAPSVPPADFDSADAIRQILDLLNERPSIRKAPGFADSVCELADQVLASGAKPEHKITALLSKFKILHESAVDGDQKAEEKLRQLAQQHAKHPSEKVTAYVRLVEMEKRLMDAENTPPAEVGKMLDDLKSYLTKERLLDRHLRMASLSVDLVNKLDEKQREPRLKELGELYAKSPDLDLASYGQRLSGKIVGDAADSLAGKPLELVGTTAGGDVFKWDGYRDRIVVVDFWATWCGPCRKELPHLREAYDRFRRDDLQVVGVSLDTDMDALRKFLDDQPLPWVTLAGRSNQDLAVKYGVAAIPTMFLVDKEGKIVARAHSIAQLVPQIETLLKVKPATPVKSE